jgi:hypothetical protein
MVSDVARSDQVKDVQTLSWALSSYSLDDVSYSVYIGLSGYALTSSQQGDASSSYVAYDDADSCTWSFCVSCASAGRVTFYLDVGAMLATLLSALATGVRSRFDSRNRKWFGVISSFVSVGLTGAAFASWITGCYDVIEFEKTSDENLYYYRGFILNVAGFGIACVVFLLHVWTPTNSLKIGGLLG